MFFKDSAKIINLCLYLKNLGRPYLKEHLSVVASESLLYYPQREKIYAV